MYELEQQIDEAVSMVHDGKRLKRKKCYFVSEKQYRSLTAQEKAAAMAKEQLFDSQSVTGGPRKTRPSQTAFYPSLATGRRTGQARGAYRPPRAASDLPPDVWEYFSLRSSRLRNRFSKMYTSERIYYIYRSG